MILTPETRFTHFLESQGIPVHGVSGSDENARIDFKIEATPAQRAAALAARTGFDWSVKELRDPSEIELDVPQLTAEQRQAVISKMIAEFLWHHPRLAESLGIVPTRLSALARR